MADMQTYIDKETGLSRVRGNAALYSRMLQMFLDSKEIVQMDESYEKRDIPEMTDLAHAIKGMVGNLALDALFEVSTQLNDELKQGELNKATYAKYKEVLKTTTEYVQQTMQSLQ